MKNTFIQSFINDKAETFLEIGSTITEEFDSIPTEFNVTMDSERTRWIDIDSKKLNKLLVKWSVTSNDVITELKKQFEPHNLIVRIK